MNKGHKRTINSLGNDNDLALNSNPVLYSQKAKAKIRKVVKRQTAKYERREPIEED